MKAKQTVSEQIAERCQPFRLADIKPGNPIYVFVGRWLNFHGSEDTESLIRAYSTHERRTPSQMLFTLNTLWARTCSSKAAQPRDGSYMVVMPEASYLLKVKTSCPSARSFPGSAIISFDDLAFDNGYRSFGTVDCGLFKPWHRFEQHVHLAEAVKHLLAFPVEAAKAFGLETGQCGVCSRKLTNPTSIHLGIGPTCLGKLS